MEPHSCMSLPFRARVHGEPTFQMKEGSMSVEFGGLLGLVVLVASVWAIVQIFHSRATTGTKVFWIVLILLLPILGLLLWFFLGPRPGRF